MAEQIELFPAPAAVRPPVGLRPAVSPPPQVFLVSAVVYQFLEARKGVRAQPACRNCRCTEADPCRLSCGDYCTLSQATGFCTRPQCLAAEARLVHGGSLAAAV